MSTPTMLSRTEGYALTDSGKAVRLDVDTLITRQAHYHWDTDAWHCTHTGLRVEHVTSPTQGRCFRWHRTRTQFVPCACGQGTQTPRR